MLHAISNEKIYGARSTFVFSHNFLVTSNANFLVMFKYYNRVNNNLKSQI